MDRGETVRLRASHDLLPIWLRQHGREPGGHVWVYEQRGPTEWIVHITRCDGQAR